MGLLLEMTDLLVKMRSETKFIGSEYCFGLSYRPIIQDVEDVWMGKERIEYWQSIVGCRHSKIFIKRPQRSRSLKLIKQNRDQI